MLAASVAIATWNRREILIQVVEALARQTLPNSDFEVIVCDSDSTDGTKDAVLDLAARYKNVRYLNVALNILAVKRNEGIRAAKANIIIFMDDDAVPDSRFVDSHVKAHQDRDGVVYCGQIRYPEKWVSESNYFRYRDSRHLGPGRPDVLSEELPPWMITVMNLSFKRTELMAKVGHVSEEFTRYGGEDTEFGFRIAAAGLRLVYLPGALVVHFEYNGSIKQYYRKLHTNSCYSSPILYRLAPEFLRATLGGYIERTCAGRGVWSIAARSIARICASSWAVKAVIGYLEYTDAFRFLYFPFVYRYLTTVAVTAGIRDRLRASESSQSHGAWFE